MAFLNELVTTLLIVVIGCTITISIMTFFSYPYSSYNTFMYFGIALILFNLLLTKEDIAFVQKID